MIDIYGPFKSLLYLPGGDMGIFAHYASNMALGLKPYIDFHPEYPPLALFFMYLPLFVDKNPLTYLFWYGVFVTIAIGLGALFIWLWSRKIIRVCLFGFMLFIMQTPPLTVYDFVYQRFDIFVSIITFSSMFFFFHYKKEGTGWFLLFLAIMTKIYPAVLIPLFFFKAKQRWRSLWFIVPMLGFNLFLILATKEGYLKSLAIQAFRPPEWESLVSTFMLGSHLFFGTKITLFFDVSSWNLEIPRQLLLYIKILVYGIVLIPFVIRHKSLRFFSPVRLATILITGFLLANASLGPQYLIWLMPFVVFLGAGEIGLFMIITIITASIYNLPLDLTQENDWVYLMLFTRNILLVIFYFKLFIQKDSRNNAVVQRGNGDFKLPL